MAFKAYVQVGKPNGTIIRRETQGQFAEHLGHCIYEGFYVGEDSAIPNVNGMRTDVVEAFKAIDTPILRWPGGCFADEYHWMDGIGPKEKRPKMINTHWGGVVEDNSFGTHEFFELCRQIGCEPYVSGNVGSGTVEEFSKWVEYMTSEGTPMAELRAKNGHEEPWHLKFFGVGNENWGCGGDMTPEYYADLARRYGTYARNYGTNQLYKIACGANGRNWEWTEVLMRKGTNGGRRGAFGALSLHEYVWWRKSHATEVSEDSWFSIQRDGFAYDSLLAGHDRIMTKYDPEKNIGLSFDEWGTWFPVEPGTNPGFLYQQNTMQDAVLAAIGLNIINAHADRVHVACIAQAVNVLQSMALTRGADMVLTPTYYVFKMFKNHQGAELCPTFVGAPEIKKGLESIPSLSVSASQRDGALLITIANASYDEDADVDFDLGGFRGMATAQILQHDAPNGHNDFDTPNEVAVKPYSGIATRMAGGFGGPVTLSGLIPARSVVAITVKPGRR